MKKEETKIGDLVEITESNHPDIHSGMRGEVTEFLENGIGVKLWGRWHFPGLPDQEEERECYVEYGHFRRVEEEGDQQ